MFNLNSMLLFRQECCFDSYDCRTCREIYKCPKEYLKKVGNLECDRQVDLLNECCNDGNDCVIGTWDTAYMKDPWLNNSYKFILGNQHQGLDAVTKPCTLPHSQQKLLI